GTWNGLAADGVLRRSPPSLGEFPRGTANGFADGCRQDHLRDRASAARRLPAGRFQRSVLVERPVDAVRLYPGNRPRHLGDREAVRPIAKRPTTSDTGRDRIGPQYDESREAALRRVARLAHLLDDRFALPGTRWRFGFDGLLGLVPGIGDAATTILAAYIILEARRLGV